MQAGLVVRLLCAYCRLSKFVLSIYYEKQRLPLAKSLGLRHMTYSKSTSLFELPQKLRPQDADSFEKRRPFLKNCVLSPKNGVSANAEFHASVSDGKILPRMQQRQVRDEHPFKTKGI